MKIELNENKVFLENKGLKKEIHPFWLRERIDGDKYIDRTIRETLIGTMFEGDNDADANMSADPEYIKLLEQLKEVAIEGTIEDEIRPIFS